VRLSPGDARGRLALQAGALLALTQVALGFLNVTLLAPVWLQLVHLLLADLLWIAYVLASASALAAAPAGARAPAAVRATS
jgi:heme A synthase